MQRKLTCVGICNGVINVINEQGNIESYCLRGLHKLSMPEQTCAIEMGLVAPQAFGLKELPRNISVVFEHPGMRARVSFDRNILYK